MKAYVSFYYPAKIQGEKSEQNYSNVQFLSLILNIKKWIWDVKVHPKWHMTRSNERLL